MELVLEMEEVERLLRKALLSEGVEVPERLCMGHRTNNKKNTFRVVFREKTSRKR